MQDTAGQLLYFGLRYYHPGLGRFINRDPAGEAGGINLHAYVGNNPGNCWDVLGLDPDDGVVILPPFEVDVKREKPQTQVTIVDMRTTIPFDLHLGDEGDISSDGDDADSNNNEAAPDPKAANKSLPPCSQFAGFNVTVQSFIGKDRIPNPIPGSIWWGGGDFKGDGPPPLDHPADRSEGYRSTNSVSIAIDRSAYMFVDQRGPTSELTVTSEAHWGQSTWYRDDGTTSYATHGPSGLSGEGYPRGDGTYLIGVFTSGGIPFLPFSGLKAPIEASAWLAFDYKTGMLSGTFTHTQFPSFQLFVNGKPVYYGKESNTPGDIQKSPKKNDVSVQLCDPSR